MQFSTSPLPAGKTRAVASQNTTQTPYRQEISLDVLFIRTCGSSIGREVSADFGPPVAVSEFVEARGASVVLLFLLL